MTQIGAYHITISYTLRRDNCCRSKRGNRRQACCRITCRDSQTSVDLRRLPDWCSEYENSSIDDTTPPAIAVVPDFTSRRSPQSDHFTNVVVQLLRCRLSRPPRVSTDVTQRRRDDNLQVIWRASPRVLCSKLHYPRLCRSVQSFTKSQMTLYSLSTSTF